jgi:hypothetical protein
MITVQQENKDQSKTKTRHRRMRVLAVIATLVGVWVLVDLYGPWSTNPRKIDPPAISHLETEMWRAYYDKKPFRLYWLLVTTFRTQSNFPFLRANLNAYNAARAAMIFKEGHSRAEYERALPYLEKYYQAICRIGNMPGDTKRLAQLELEWWIVHREHERFGKAELERTIAECTAGYYGIKAESLTFYAERRAAAMLQRDESTKSGIINDRIWQEIETKLLESYEALSIAVAQPISS